MAIEVVQLGVEVARRYPRVSQRTEYRELRWEPASQYRSYRLPVDEVGLTFQLDMESGEWGRKVKVEEVVLHDIFEKSGHVLVGYSEELDILLIATEEGWPRRQLRG
jgi:hypothetical protein